MGTPSNYPSPDHSFTLQMIMELQKSTGQLTECVNSLRTSLDRQSGQLDKIEEKVSGVTHKLYAASVVLAILLVVGGFIIDKTWDLMAQQISFKQEAATKQELPSKTLNAR
jgi:hypothetical protein